MITKGRVWKFGDEISTDLMMPSISRYGKVPQDQMKNYCMYAVRPEFAKEVAPGDIVVAGKHCGIGSSRPAPENFMALGVGCIIAESFGHLFFRNAISVGFPVIEAPGVSTMFSDGDQGEVDIEQGVIRNITTGKSMNFKPYPDMITKIFKAGGVMGLLKQELGLEEKDTRDIAKTGHYWT